MKQVEQNGCWLCSFSYGLSVDLPVCTVVHPPNCSPWGQRRDSSILSQYALERCLEEGPKKKRGRRLPFYFLATLSCLKREASCVRRRELKSWNTQLGVTKCNLVLNRTPFTPTLRSALTDWATGVSLEWWLPATAKQPPTLAEWGARLSYGVQSIKIAARLLHAFSTIRLNTRKQSLGHKG